MYTVHTSSSVDDAMRRAKVRREKHKRAVGVSSNHGPLATSRPDFGEFIERRAPHAGFLLVRGENFVKE